MLVTNKQYTEKYKNKFRVNINKQNIERVNEFKYLGVLIDHKLRWNKHIDYLRVNPILDGLLRGITGWGGRFGPPSAFENY